MKCLKMGVSIFTALLIIISTLTSNFLSDDFMLKNILVFIGNPAIAMLISVLIAIYTLGLARGKKITEIMDSVTRSISSITMVLLIIAGAGALKQIFIDSGVSNYIGELMTNSTISPLL